MKNRKICRICCTVLVLCTLLGLAGCGRREAQITSLNELNGKTVSVLTGSLYASLVKQNEEMPDAQITYTASNADGLAWLLGGKTDALVSDYVMAQTFVRKYDGLIVLDETLNSSCYGIAFQKNDPLCILFNKEIADMKADGTIDELINIWMGDEESAKTVREQTWTGSRGTLKCRMADDFEPMCYRNTEGKLVGFDVDLVIRIAERLDYKIEFSTAEIADLLPAVMSGQADFAASGITVTESREADVDFSDGYLDDSTVVLVRDVNAAASGTGFFLSIKNSFHRVFVENARWKDLLRGLMKTVLISVLSAIAGSIFGGLMFLWDYSGSKVAGKLLAVVGRLFVLLPPSTWLLIVFYIIFANNKAGSIWTAVFAFSITFGFAVFGDFKDAIGLVNKGQSEAAFSMGYGRYKVLTKILIPQALPRFLSVMQVEVIGLIRFTALAGYLAVLDLQAAADNIRAHTFEPFLPIIVTAVVYIALAAIASRLVMKLKIKLSPSEKSEEEIMSRLMKGRI